MKLKNKNKKGFTLIELLVVVLIIGLLSAIAIPFYFKAMEKTRAAEALSMLGSIARAEDRIKFATENQEYTDQLGVLDINPAVYSQQDASSFDSQYFDFTLGMEKAKAKRKPTSSEDYALYIDYATAKITCSNNNGSGMCARLGFEEVEESNVGGSQEEANWEDCNGAFDARGGSMWGPESSFATCKVKNGNNQTEFYTCTDWGYCFQDVFDSQNRQVYDSMFVCNSLDETTGMCQDDNISGDFAVYEYEDGLRRVKNYYCNSFNGTTCETLDYGAGLRLIERYDDGRRYEGYCDGDHMSAEGDCSFYYSELLEGPNYYLSISKELNENNEVVIDSAWLSYIDENKEYHYCSGADVDVENRVCLN